jgi:exodeoxyribonuclease VII small subunit
MARASSGANPPDNSSGAAGPAAPAGPSFEDSIEQVEQIIDRIERGEQGLERSIADYERGAGLLKKCREILARSEQRIQEIEADLTAASPVAGAGASRPAPNQPLKRAPGGAGGPGNAPSAGAGASTGTPPASDDGDDTPF